MSQVRSLPLWPCPEAAAWFGGSRLAHRAVQLNTEDELR